MKILETKYDEVKLKILETKEIDIKDIIIGKCLMRPLEELKGNEELKNLSDSMDVIGQLHPCIVRIVGDNYELIAGGRRYIALSQKKNKIEVKIVIASDLDAMELGIIENVHRKDDLIRRDEQIYKAWKMGNKSGKYKYVRDLANKISMSENSVSRIIAGGKDREKNNSYIFQKATTRDLEVTRSLIAYPKLREKILDVGKKSSISVKDIGEISKKIKTTLGQGVKENTVNKVIDLTLSPKNISTDIKRNESTENLSVNVQPKKLVKILDTLEQFSTDDARNQVLKEMEVMIKQKDVSVKLHDDALNEHLETRKKQEQDMNENGNTKLRTKFDEKLERKLELEQTYDQRQEKVFLERYQKLALDTSIVFSTFHPRKLKTEQGKKDVINVIKDIYAFYRLLLEEVGEIHNVENIGASKKVDDIEILKIT